MYEHRRVLTWYAELTREQGETSVKILTSIREKDVFVVQSGSSKINDSIMELLILISACKGGSANKITGRSPLQIYSATGMES